MMNALQNARLRRHLPLLGALVVLIAFSITHLLAFQPLANRYKRALSHAGAMGAILDPNGVSTPTLPPRVFTLLMDNSLPAAEADRKGASGALGAEMVQSLSVTANRHALEVVVAEPGLLTQQAGSIEGRAHLRLRGSYSGFVGFLDELSRSGRLWRVERYTITPVTNGTRCDIEVYLAGCLLKRTGGRS